MTDTKEKMPDSLFESFENIIVLDTETTGVDPKTDEIIELGALRIKRGASVPDAEMNELIRLSDGRALPPVITDITGITPTQLERDGIEKAAAGRSFAELLNCEKPLIVAYNAQFDLCFLYFFLKRLGLEGSLKGVKMLDALTVYKDRRPYPHKLCDAVNAYALEGENTHRAVDDARAALELLYAMEREKNDLMKYVGLFGYNPRYGVSGPKISSVKYLPQGYDVCAPLYEQPEV